MYTGDFNRSFPFWGEIGPYLSPGFLSLVFWLREKVRSKNGDWRWSRRRCLDMNLLGQRSGKGVRWMDEMILRVEQNDDDDDDDDNDNDDGDADADADDDDDDDDDGWRC